MKSITNTLLEAFLSLGLCFDSGTCRREVFGIQDNKGVCVIQVTWIHLKAEPRRISGGYRVKLTTHEPLEHRRYEAIHKTLHLPLEAQEKSMKANRLEPSLR